MTRARITLYSSSRSCLRTSRPSNQAAVLYSSRLLYAASRRHLLRSYGGLRPSWGISTLKSGEVTTSGWPLSNPYQRQRKCPRTQALLDQYSHPEVKDIRVSRGRCARTLAVEASVDELALLLQECEQGLRRWVQMPAPTSPWWSAFSDHLTTHKREREILLAKRRQVLSMLYARVNPGLERFLRAHSWKYSGIADVEDLRNEVWSLLMERIADFDPARGNFAVWFDLYVVCVVLNRERRRKLRRGPHLGDNTLMRIAAPEQDRPLQQWSDECGKLINQTVAGMPPRWRAILLGLYFCEPPKKQTELARELGISPAAVHQNKLRALAHLRAILDAQGCAL